VYYRHDPTLWRPLVSSQANSRDLCTFATAVGSSTNVPTMTWRQMYFGARIHNSNIRSSSDCGSDGRCLTIAIGSFASQATDRMFRCLLPELGTAHSYCWLCTLHTLTGSNVNEQVLVTQDG
jgi:hypothetical protein